MIKKIASISFVITLLVALCVPALAMTNEYTRSINQREENLSCRSLRVHCYSIGLGRS